MDLCNQNEIKSLLSRHGFRFAKSMGQNFLIQRWVPEDTAEASGASSDTGVLEIGPGIGPLTEQLARRAAKVAAVELDQRLLPVLEETLSAYDNITIIPGDIMKIDLPALCREQFPGLTPIACANLPYNITTPVITSLLECRCFSSVTVMIQKEVAERICAAPGTAQYGAFSLLCQYYADCELLYEVPPECFLPPPKVTSAVIRMTARPEPPVPVGDPNVFFKVVRAAFAQRRKTLLNALGSLDVGGAFSKDELREILASCELPETVRGERLSFAQFAMLSHKIMESHSLIQ